MTQENILTLAKAGFTAAQIAALANAQQSVQPAVVAQPSNPAQMPVQTPSPTDTNAQVLAELQKLTGMAQNTAVLGASLPQQPQRTTDEILAEIINPPTNTNTHGGVQNG